MVHKKLNLAMKICQVCGKSFNWRKKWQRDWDRVKYCSDKCKKNNLKQNRYQT